VLSVGENTAVSCCVPAGRTVPAAGLYIKLPGTFAVAFSCVVLRAVPVAIEAGAAHVIAGVAWLTASCAEAVAAEYVFVSLGVKMTEAAGSLF